MRIGEDDFSDGVGGYAVAGQVLIFPDTPRDRLADVDEGLIVGAGRGRPMAHHDETHIGIGLGIGLDSGIAAIVRLYEERRGVDTRAAHVHAQVDAPLQGRGIGAHAGGLAGGGVVVGEHDLGDLVRSHTVGIEVMGLPSRAGAHREGIELFDVDPAVPVA